MGEESGEFHEPPGNDEDEDRFERMINARKERYVPAERVDTEALSPELVDERLKSIEAATAGEEKTWGQSGTFERIFVFPEYTALRNGAAEYTPPGEREEIIAHPSSSERAEKIASAGTGSGLAHRVFYQGAPGRCGFRRSPASMDVA